MTNYINSIETAFFVFPLIAFLFTMPYVIYNYHKYGAIMIFRTLIVYSFVLYLMCIYFLVILPLPSFERVEKLTTSFTQLIPFQFVFDFFKDSGFIWNQPSSYFEAIKHPSFYNVIFNIFMFVPFGIYLRYYFKCSFSKSLLYSFLLSLFFELTQLSGLYGIYPRPYRLFDVDDLLVNTSGGIIGYSVTSLLKFLPSRERLDELSYKKGEQVTIYRRFNAFLIDLIIIAALNLVFQKIFITAIVYFSVLPLFTRGRTIGKRIVQIRLISFDNKDCKWYQYYIRYGLLFGVLLGTPYLIITGFSNFYFDSNTINLILFLIISFVLICFYVLFFFQLMRALLFSKKLFFYEKISKTKNINTVSDQSKKEL